MTNTESTRNLNLEPEDNHRLAILCGQFNQHLHQIERHLGVEVVNRGAEFQIIGIPTSVDIAYQVLQELYEETLTQQHISSHQVMLIVKSIESKHKQTAEYKLSESMVLHVNKSIVKPRTPNQQHYVAAIAKHDINFGIGPSGTGKTFLAVASAVAALEKEQVNRIVLVRPAVEAGESLGFLPGDLAQKIDPYLRPLYDALYEMLGINRINHLLSKGIIEIAPLAYMRGRTLNDSFIILDEGQNSTKEQMKMFLTRIGFGSKAVITGDITQVDLPKRIESGLRHAITLLKDIEGIQFSFFKSNDVVRHPIVQHIIEAYENQES